MCCGCCFLHKRQQLPITQHIACILPMKIAKDPQPTREGVHAWPHGAAEVHRRCSGAGSDGAAQAAVHRAAGVGALGVETVEL